MARLNVNPTVEANVAFDIVQQGEYTMRVEEITPFTSARSGSACLRVRFSFTGAEALTKLNGDAAQNTGGLFDNGIVTSPPEKQGKLRSLVEACGLPWADLDTDDLVGKECKVKVKIEEYQGEQKNAVARYLPLA